MGGDNCLCVETFGCTPQNDLSYVHTGIIIVLSQKRNYRATIPKVKKLVNGYTLISNLTWGRLKETALCMPSQTRGYA